MEVIRSNKHGYILQAKVMQELCDNSNTHVICPKSQVTIYEGKTYVSTKLAISVCATMKDKHPSFGFMEMAIKAAVEELENTRSGAEQSLGSPRTVTSFCRDISIAPKQVFNLLSRKLYIYKKDDYAKWRPSASGLRTGLVAAVTRPNRANNEVYFQLVLTSKGETWIKELFT